MNNVDTNQANRSETSRGENSFLHRLADRDKLESVLLSVCRGKCRTTRRSRSPLEDQVAKLVVMDLDQPLAISQKGRQLIGNIRNRLLGGTFGFGIPQLRIVPKKSNSFADRVHYGNCFPLVQAWDEDFLGKFRVIGSPRLPDLVVQRRIFSLLQEALDPKFSDQSFGFRNDRQRFGCGPAIARLEYLRDQGNHWVARIDIRRFFDEVVHSIVFDQLNQALRTSWPDQDVDDLFQLLESFLSCSPRMKGHDVDGHPMRDRGSIQGSPLSNVLANLYLDPLDNWIEDRGWQHVRFADDVAICFAAREEAEKALEEVDDFVQSDLKLRLSNDASGTPKSLVQSFAEGIDFLGFQVFENEKLIRPGSIKKFKNRIRMITRSGRLHPALNYELSMGEVIRDVNLQLGFALDYESMTMGQFEHVFLGLRNWPGFFLRIDRGPQILEQFRQVDRFIRDRLRKRILITSGACEQWRDMPRASRQQFIGKTNRKLHQNGLKSLAATYQRAANLIEARANSGEVKED